MTLCLILRTIRKNNDFLSLARLQIAQFPALTFIHSINSAQHNSLKLSNIPTQGFTDMSSQSVSVGNQSAAQHPPERTYGNLGPPPPVYYEEVEINPTTYLSQPPPAYTSGSSSRFPTKIASFNPFTRLASLNPLSRIASSRPDPELEIHELPTYSEAASVYTPINRSVPCVGSRRGKRLAAAVIILLLLLLFGFLVGMGILAEHLQKKNNEKAEGGTAYYDQCVAMHPFFYLMMC